MQNVVPLVEPSYTPQTIFTLQKKKTDLASIMAKVSQTKYTVNILLRFILIFMQTSYFLEYKQRLKMTENISGKEVEELQKL